MIVRPMPHIAWGASLESQQVSRLYRAFVANGAAAGGFLCITSHGQREELDPRVVRLSRTIGLFEDGRE